MKKKDLTLIVVVVFFSAVISLLLSNILISSPDNRQEKVEVVNPITAEFNEPEDKYFNPDSVNPTQLIQIGDNPNPTPFGN